MKIFMATKKGRSLMSQDAMQVTGRQQVKLIETTL